MKTSGFIIFFSIVLTIYGSINYYIYIRGLQCIPYTSNLRIIYKTAFLVMFSSYIISRFLERYMINFVTNTFTWIGSFWLGGMVYFLIFIILFDMLRSINHLLPFFPALITYNYQQTKSILFLLTSAIVGVLIIAGYVNTINTNVKTLSINIHKKIKDISGLNIALATDIHLGTTINKNRATYLVNKINSMHPDIIILAGDILDEVLAPVIKYNIGDILKNLNAPMGVYAITGNHEYIGGIEQACNYISAHNITLIRDTAILVNNKFYLAGREDRDRYRFTGNRRMSINEVLKNIDKSYPIILLDHQPFNLKEAEEAGIDLQLSGHTHHAQLWPLNYITEKIYEMDWGYIKKGNTQYYISCGFGTWGPPMRIGSRSEIVNINIRFDK
jgi:uncharacterized protein